MEIDEDERVITCIENLDIIYSRYQSYQLFLAFVNNSAILEMSRTNNSLFTKNFIIELILGKTSNLPRIINFAIRIWGLNPNLALGIVQKNAEDSKEDIEADIANLVYAEMLDPMQESVLGLGSEHVVEGVELARQHSAELNQDDIELFEFDNHDIYIESSAHFIQTCKWLRRNAEIIRAIKEVYPRATCRVPEQIPRSEVTKKFDDILETANILSRSLLLIEAECAPLYILIRLAESGYAHECALFASRVNPNILRNRRLLSRILDKLQLRSNLLDTFFPPNMNMGKRRKKSKMSRRRVHSSR